MARSARRCVRERGSTIYGVETPVRVGPERDFGSAAPLAMPRKSEDADADADPDPDPDPDTGRR